MKKLIILLFLVSFNYAGNTITGIVIDGKNRSPIKNATVFIDQTTIKTTTNQTGQFTIKNIPDGIYQIVVFSSGYKLYSHEISVHKNTNLGKFSIVNLSNDVKSNLQNIEFQRNLKKFKKLFLGSSIESEKCEIKNPEVLRINYIDNSSISAVTYSPLIIDNPSLGYYVYLFLLYFDWSIDTDQGNFQIRYYFEKQIPISEKQKKSWIKNRIQSYKGSLQHFVNSLATEKLFENDFILIQPEEHEYNQIQKFYKEKNQLKYYEKGYQNKILRKISKKVRLKCRLLNFENYLFIVYKESPDIDYLNSRFENKIDQYDTPGNQTSKITLVNGPLLIYPNGYINDYYGTLKKSGYFSWKRFANKVPFNFSYKEGK